MKADSARAELAQAAAARDAFVGSISYPRWYLVQTAVGAALLVAGTGALGADGSPAADPAPTAVRVVLGIGFVIGFVLVIWGLRRFERSNGVQVSGFRFARRASAAYMAAFIVISSLSVAVGVWWVGLIGAPVVAAMTVAFLRFWLHDYRHAPARRGL